jgi:hypothetical protein
MLGVYDVEWIACERAGRAVDTESTTHGEPEPNFSVRVAAGLSFRVQV